MGAGAVLHLKKRTVRGSLQVPMSLINAIVESGDKGKLWDLLSQVKDQEQFVHDQRWLEYVVNWEPEKGQPAKEHAKWLGLIIRVDKLDDTTEGTFTLNAQQVTMIWARMQRDDFKAPKGPLWAAFELELLDAMGVHYSEVINGDWDDPDSAEESAADDSNKAPGR